MNPRMVATLGMLVVLGGCAEGGGPVVGDGAGVTTDSEPTDGRSLDLSVDADGPLADIGPKPDRARDLSGESVPCGDKDCNDGIPCTEDLCVASGCQNRVKSGYCLIGGGCYNEGSKKPGTACTRCVSTRSSRSWTEDPKACPDDGKACTTAVCSAGTCSSPLSAGYCLIGGVCIKSGTVNPKDSCKKCDSAQSTVAYVNQTDGASCASDSKSCTQDVCTSGSCTHPLSTGFCLIGGACQTLGAKNPGNSCQECNPALTSGAWSSAPAGSACPDDGKACTDDRCQGSTCVHPLKTDRCMIGGICYTLGYLRPGNNCQECTPGLSTGSWSNRIDGSGCPSGRCYNGSCCTGCARGTSCLPGTTPADCGTGGAPCATCGGGQVCSKGQCINVGVTYTFNVGPAGSPYTGYTRGFWFIAPVGFTIVGLRVPTNVGTGPQNIQVMRFTSPPPAFSSSTASHTTLTYQRQVNGSAFVPVNIRINAGEVIGILGARGTGSSLANSYASTSNYTTSILSRSVTLQRLIYQGSIASSPAGAVSSEASGFYSRIEMQYRQ